MATLTLDGTPLPLDRPPETLADLLAAADAACAGRGRIVTAVRLDGAEEPAFREPHVTTLAASDLSAVAIESGTPEGLASSCLSEAGVALQSLAGAAVDVARRFRSGDIRNGNSDLVAIAQGMATVLTITNAASLGLGIDLGAKETANGSLSAIAQKAAADLDTIIAAQVAADWNTVARTLDRQLAPDLRTWGDVCAGLGLQPDDAVPVSPLQNSDPAR